MAMLKQYSVSHYGGLESERPATLPYGDTYFAEDTEILWKYNQQRVGVPISLRGRNTGWASYVDTQYSDIAPFSVLADTPTQVPNNAGTVIDSQKPLYIPKYWDEVTQKILGREGDALDIMLYWKGVPNAVNEQLRVWIDIGTPGNPIELYSQTFYFRGATEKGILYALSSSYTLDTWEANGATVWCESSANIDMYNFVFNFDTSHRAR